MDICANGFTVPNECCHINPGDDDEGMEGHQYFIDITTSTNYQNSHFNCLINGLGDSTHGYQLATFETRKENYCVAKYINKMYPTKNFGFYIGLEAETSDYQKNAFLWDAPMSSQILANPDANVPTFTNWANNAPNGQDCVKMNTGTSLATNGLWNDVACTTLLFSICEKYPK